MTTATEIKYNIAERDGEAQSASVFIGSENLVATQGHRNFAAILQALVDGADETTIRELFDIGAAINNRFQHLSERVMINGNNIYFDGDKQDGALATAITRFFYEGNLDFTPLVLFMEKIKQNPNPHSQAQLYPWLQQHHFGITETGDIVAFKGVNPKGGEADTEVFLSVHSGTAFVNGELFQNKQIPTSPGTVVEMPRNQVAHKPSVDCSTGLHAGTWEYARSFASVLLRVQINPRDVVSVPTDCNGSKMRVCRYKVLGRTNRDEMDTSVLFVKDRLLDLTAKAKTLPEPRKQTSFKTPKPSTGADITPPDRVKTILDSADKDAAQEIVDTAAKVLDKKSTRKTAPVKKVTAKATGAKTKTAPTKAVAKKVAEKKAAAAKKEPPKPAKKATTKKAAVPKTVAKKVPVKKSVDKTPEFYEQFTEAQFVSMTRTQQTWLAKEWEIKPIPRTVPALVAALVETSKVRRRKAATKASTRVS